MAKTKIEWADRVWNPVTGCTKVSEGCRNCYAETIASRFWKDRKFSDVKIHPDRFGQPLDWGKPAGIFVNSMSDLFHKDIPFKFISEIFHIMRIAKQHSFMVLTKRPENMLKFIEWQKNACDLDWQSAHKNIWLGVSVEDQKTADVRIPLLLQTPAAVRFVSCEPLLGPLDFWKFATGEETFGSMYDHRGSYGFIPGLPKEPIKYHEGIDWVIVGGESGKNARPMHPDWVRSIRDQCVDAGVPFFFKQWGEWQWTDERLEIQRLANGEKERKLTSIKAPGVIGYKEVWFRWVGKKKAGRLLDGREWNDFPEVV